MLALFKGELSYHEFMREMTYKEMMSLRDARVEQLTNERKSFEQDRQEAERKRIRDQLLSTESAINRSGN